ncbi:electron transport complex subunit RsxC [Geoalkalibacter halelectricus]|uniref:Ion-translocating oxidoreductase complex subunit C n=1 Tax=Geoalkalibacter halelectricus TaxID=2847045 RepID=A0ABY5ZFP9_9BACT|nr:electron transport complex subunit RsxC [Geoalkalibacter halelectricus]MDO3378154.1 electron transport complex subunit RsxC [Geoalkalibacter halelectricus]UWZ78000.1 electron transport complex subunit RsxC [Geoalkalibacter halelectricus]
MTKKYKTFRGGLHPPENKAGSAHKPIEDCPLPAELVIPLSLHVGVPAEVCVAPGEQVLKGQMIGRARGLVSVPVHASTSGEVIAVEPRPHPSGKVLEAVVLRPDGADTPCDRVGEDQVHDWSATELLERIREAGIVGLGGATFPAHIKLSPPPQKPIDVLIINGAECEPYLTADHRLMVEQAEQVVRGSDIFRRVLGAKRVCVGIESNKPDAIQAMRRACTAAGMEVVVLATKYPQGAEKQLIFALTGREVPRGALPMDIGALVQNVGTAAATAEALSSGMPLIERVVTVAGPGVAEAKNLRVRIGTPLAHLVDYCGGIRGNLAKVLVGGPMMGAAQLGLDVPVVPATSGVLLLREEDLVLRPEGPCIRCGRCVQVCPSRLCPTTIAAYARLGRMDEAKDYNAMDCIECGSCSYTCPSAIPLVQSIRHAKASILAQRKKH